MLDDLLEIGRAQLDHEASPLNAQEEEQILNQAQLALGVAMDDLEVTPALIAEAIEIDLLQQLGIPDDRRQRRSKLMGDEGKELVLGSFRLAGGVSARLAAPSLLRALLHPREKVVPERDVLDQGEDL